MQLLSSQTPVTRTAPSSVEHQWNDSAPPLNEIAQTVEIRGYAVVRNALPRDLVLELRRNFFSSFAHVGVSVEGELFSPDQASTVMEKFGLPGHPSSLLQACHGYRQLIEAAPLLMIAERLLSSSARLLPRQVLRLYTRFSRSGAMAHFDEAFVCRPPRMFCNAWIPLGRADAGIGTLIYLPGSHLKDVYRARDVFHSTLTDTPKDGYPFGANLDAIAALLELDRWEYVELGPGDVSIHHPRTLHASTDSCSDYSRLVTDVRFVPSNWFADSRWDETWTSDDMHKWNAINRPTSRDASQETPPK